MLIFPLNSFKPPATCRTLAPAHPGRCCIWSKGDEGGKFNDGLFIEVLFEPFQQGAVDHAVKMRNSFRIGQRRSFPVGEKRRVHEDTEFPELGLSLRRRFKPVAELRSIQNAHALICDTRAMMSEGRSLNAAHFYKKS